MSDAERLSITIDDYHNSRGWFSNSDLSHMAKWDRGIPNWTPHIMRSHLDRLGSRKPTKAMEVGQAFDVLITDPDRFDMIYAVAEVSDKRTKAYKAFVAANPFKKILSQAESDQLNWMADSLLGHPEFPSENPENAQSTIRWNYSQDVGLQCRPDLEFPGLVVDVKTTACTNPEDWMRDVAGYGYHRQAALYMDGVERAAGTRPFFRFAVVSKEPPYPAWVAELPESAIELGRSQNELILSVLEANIQFDAWKAPWQSEVSTLDIPYWAYPRDN